ncbi:hypothetical protein X961_4542 [Burkholderia pseudomallei MSHR5613]|nr:hypothetical protein X961_4542 [Burkholderia pseudomallei MSHR5613]
MCVLSFARGFRRRPGGCEPRRIGRRAPPKHYIDRCQDELQASIASNRRIDSSLARARRTQQARRSRRATHDRAPLLAAPSCGIGSADPRPRRRRAAATLATATACCNAASPAGRERGRGCARGATGYAAAALARRAPLTFMGRTPWRQARDRVTAGIRPDAATTRARPRPARTRLSAAGMGDRRFGSIGNESAPVGAREPSRCGRPLIGVNRARGRSPMLGGVRRAAHRH